MYASQCRIEGLESDDMSSIVQPSRQIEAEQAAQRSDHAPRACNSTVAHVDADADAAAAAAAADMEYGLISY